MKREKEKVRMRKSQTTVIIIFLLDYIFLRKQGCSQPKILGVGGREQSERFLELGHRGRSESPVGVWGETPEAEPLFAF